MPKLVHKRPAYSHHKQSNRGRVCIGGKYHYLPGAYDSAESNAAYWALIHRLEKGDVVDDEAKGQAVEAGQVEELGCATPPDGGGAGREV